MVFVRSALAAVCLLFAPVAFADSDGVPSIDGAWSGKIKAVYYDQTNEGAVHPKQKYKDRVEVEIFQDEGEGDFELDITFDNGLPTSGDTLLLAAEIGGNVGNYHVSIASDGETAPPLVGSGKVTKNGKKLKIKGMAATSDYTIEFQMELKKRND